MTTFTVAEFCHEIKSSNLMKWMIAYYLRSFWIGLDNQISVYEEILERNMVQSHLLEKLSEIVTSFWDVMLEMKNGVWIKGQFQQKPWVIKYLGSDGDHRKARNFLHFLALEIRVREDRKLEILDLQYLMFLRAALLDLANTERGAMICKTYLPVIERTITYID